MIRNKLLRQLEVIAKGIHNRQLSGSWILEDAINALQVAEELAKVLEDADGSSYHIQGDACLTKEATKQRNDVLEKWRKVYTERGK